MTKTWETLPSIVTESPMTQWGLLPNTIVENGSRLIVSATNVAIVEGQLYMIGGLVIPAGKTVSTIGMFSGATAFTAGATNHQWFSLYRQSDRALLGVTSDDTNTAWAGRSFKSLSLATPARVAVDTPVYVGVVVTVGVGGVMPNLASLPASIANAVAGVPIASGNSTAGLVDPSTAPNPAAAITPGANTPYAVLA